MTIPCFHSGYRPCDDCALPQLSAGAAPSQAAENNIFHRCGGRFGIAVGDYRRVAGFMERLSTASQAPTRLRDRA
jgi:hypothetical protein